MLFLIPFRMMLLLPLTKFVSGIPAPPKISTLDHHLLISCMRKEGVLHQLHLMETPFILGISMANLNMKSLEPCKK